MPTTIVRNLGQTPEQQSADQAACSNEAMAQSGYNPSAPPPSVSAQPVAGERLHGAARGAAAGAVRESHTDAADREVEDLTQGAARLGAAVGGVRQRTERRETARATKAARATYAQAQSTYNQVVANCMTAKG